MARSSYIYVLFFKEGVIFGTFTVKKEMLHYAMKVWPDGYYIRFRDNDPTAKAEKVFLRDLTL